MAIKHLKPRPWWQIWLNKFLDLFRKKEKGPFFGVYAAYAGRGLLISQDLVSVQPMATPVGTLFYLDYVYAPFITNDVSVNEIKET